jgi:hypothetical protein
MSCPRKELINFDANYGNLKLDYMIYMINEEQTQIEEENNHELPGRLCDLRKKTISC